MANLLDVLGASIIGLYVMFMVAQFNMRVNNAAYNILSNNIAQLNAVTTSEILEYDLYKIGYRISSKDKITVAKADEIKYLTDIDNDGNEDIVRLYLGNTTEMSSTSNPNDRPLYRELNGGSPNLVSIVSDFKLSYLDSTGAKISPISKLSSAVERKKISSIGVYFKVESRESTDGIYKGTEWKRTLRLKNIY